MRRKHRSVRPFSKAPMAFLAIAILSSILFLSILLLPEEAAAQIRAPSTLGRIVESTAEPEAPPFGQVFELHVTYRVPPGGSVIVLDTLGPTYALRSAGRASWDLVEAPGDSTDFVATFPVLSFRSGLEPLPGLLVLDGRDVSVVGGGAAEINGATGEGGTGDAGSRSSPAIRVVGGPTDLPGLDETGAVEETGGTSLLGRLYLGDAQIQPIEELTAEGDRPPRPPADVLGADWSLWAVLALLAVLGAVAGLIRMIIPLLRSRWPASVETAPAIGPLTRTEALQRLDEIRSRGWHENGRIEEFYRASTDTLRRYVEGRDSTWNEALTSHELLVEARRRWGADRTGPVEPAVEVAERVKFGRLRPGGSDAVRDWEAIRSWIAGDPESDENGSGARRRSEETP